MFFIITALSCLVSVGFVHCSESEHQKFDQVILAYGFPYYKLLLSLGTCKKEVIFEEQKAWGNLKLNRILDIYYKSDVPEYLVSRVEIRLVLNETDTFAYSEKGVGHPEFGATVFIPTRVSIIFYRLTIFTCSTPSPPNDQDLVNEESGETVSAGRLPFYIKPDSEIHHIVFDKDKNTDADDDDDDDEEAERRKNFSDQ